MNRTDFLNMIGKNSPVNRSMLGEVYELLDLFPYFQSAHMLLLKGLNDNDDVKFEKQLRTSAVHIADREVLYYLLKNEKTKEPEAENITPETVSSYSENDDQTPFMQQTVIEAAMNSDLLISEYEKEAGESEGEALPAGTSEAEPGSVIVAESNSVDDSESIILVMDDNVQGEEEKVFFMDPGFSMPEKEDLLELDTESSESVLQKPDTENGEIIYEVSDRDSRKKLQNDLIDKFIITNPRIEPVRDKTDILVEDLSKPHIVEKGGFVTETLARIYISQGYYSKAIEIYEKLSLKFPEKSSYFAAQIEKVKEYIKK